MAVQYISSSSHTKLILWDAYSHTSKICYFELCVCVLACMHTCICLCMYVCMRVCVCVCVCVFVCECICMCICGCMCAHACVRLCVHICVLVLCNTIDTTLVSIPNLVLQRKAWVSLVSGLFY